MAALMKITPFIAAEHYPTLSAWWRDQRWPPVPLDMLPELGLVVTDDHEAHAAGWLYTTNSPIALIEWLVGNPNSSHETRGQALDTLIEALTRAAHSRGFRHVWSSLVHDRLIERYKRLGFTVADKHATNMIRGTVWQ